MTQPPPNNESPLLSGLTDAQRKAATHLDGPMLVLAGPGSGKTSVVTRRIAWLLSQGIPPWSILALTFTNKAAGEMRERIQTLTQGATQRGLTVSTFHAFCARLLRMHGEAAGLPANYTIYDGSDQRDAVKQAIKSAELNTSNFPPASVAARISDAKNNLLTPDEFAAQADDYYSRTVAKIYAAYQARLRRADAVDFDDLLMRIARLLRENTPTRTALQNRYQYVLVDEYQDTNHAQFVIADAIAAAHRNICVVGDPDQSIYGWRGADINNILEFEAQYPGAAIIPLGQNFRSTAHIVHAADTLIQNNTQRKHKPLHTELDDGEEPTVVHCRDERHEARVIIEAFRQAHNNDVPWKEMAVVYRTNALSRVLEDAFREASIPYVIARGTAFYERKEIKDALAYLRLVANPNDDASLRRIINVPTRGIGKTSLERADRFAHTNNITLLQALERADEITDLTARAQAAIGRFIDILHAWRIPSEDNIFDAGEHDLASLVERVVRESGLEAMFSKGRHEDDIERVENLGELVSAAAQFVMPRADEGVNYTINEVDDVVASLSAPTDDIQPTALEQLTAYLESVTLISDADMVDPENGAVTLLTLHAAKGLEFDAVAIAGLEEGLLPHIRSLDSENDMEEERRLCFVGMTRARRHLLMCRAAQRTVRGIPEITRPSRFIGELPEDGINTIDHVGQRSVAAIFEDDVAQYDPYADEVDQTQRTLDAGTLVKHPQFGLGRVDSVTRRPVGSSARVTFNDVGVKTLIIEYANLRIID